MAAPSQQNHRDAQMLERNYEKICELSASGYIPVTKYKSLRTGIHVVIAQVEGPLVHGYFTLATEPSNDHGLPHTLEHLVFLGSEDYPYKGVLDLLANRCLSSGTNAWTDTDHTAYTVETAGSEGFLNLLPIYLDHLLYPTLTESGFMLEVHHVNGEGEDAGVVYSEMQARENSDSDRCFLELVRDMYPKPCGYRYETGGILKDLRDNVTIEEIRDYHSAYYRPENLHVIIAGHVDPVEVFAALEPIEKKILSKLKQNRKPFVRPWHSPVPPLTASSERAVLYPSEDEDTGMVLVGWRGPSSVNNYNELVSLETLMEYMMQSSISPLTSVFVEVEDPLAANVKASCSENSESMCYFQFVGVPKSKINDVKALLVATLAKLATGDIPFDMKVMKDTLMNLVQKQQSNLEMAPHDTIASSVIGDALYGNVVADLEVRLNKKRWYETLLLHPEIFWVSLLKKYLLEGNSVTILGEPSVAEGKRLEKEEKRRIQGRLLDIEEEKLQQIKVNLETAQKQNDMPPPPAMLSMLPVPGLDGVHFHPLSAYANHKVTSFSSEESRPNRFDVDRIPFKFQADHIHSSFVQLTAILDTSLLPPPLRGYLPLLLELLFESNMRLENETIPYQEVVKKLTADTISHATGLGLDVNTETFRCGPYCSNALVDLKVESGKYLQGVEWLQKALYQSQFAEDRMRVKASKLLNAISDEKRQGPTLLRLMHQGVFFSKDANQNQVNILNQQKFFTKLMARLDTESSTVLKEIELVRQTITQPDALTVHMAADLDKLAIVTDSVEPWRNFVRSKNFSKQKKLTIISESELLVSPDNMSTATAFMSGVASVDSGYLWLSTRCLTEHTHWDVPALLTALQYLQQTEGPMWKELRGKGFAYAAFLVLNPTEGLLTLKISKSAQLSNAYQAALKLISWHLNPSTVWDDKLLESARSSLQYEVMEREALVSDVVQQSLLSYFRGVSHTYNRDLVDRIGHVSMAEVKLAAAKYLTPLLQPQNSRAVVITNPSKIGELAQSFQRLHHKVEVIESLENSQFVQL